MTTVFVNPGSGPVADATAAHALENIAMLLVDAGLSDAPYRADPSQDENGRFRFVVDTPAGECTVDMPGIPLVEVRYVAAPGQNIWHFPRLYVDGSSWVWMFAVNRLRDRATPSASDAEGTG